MKAYELLDKPEKWTQGAFGRLPSGKTCSGNSPEACKWCLSGALELCYYNTSAELYWRQRERIVQKINSKMTYWNDTPGRTYEEVYNLLKELDI